MVPQRPGLIGRPGWVRSSAWIWDFSSIDRTTGCAGGVHIEADNVFDLLGEGGIVGTLERADAMRLEVVCLPNALHRAQRQADRLSHRSAGPGGCFAGGP